MMKAGNNIQEQLITTNVVVGDNHALDLHHRPPTIIDHLILDLHEKKNDRRLEKLYCKQAYSFVASHKS